MATRCCDRVRIRMLLHDHRLGDRVTSMLPVRTRVACARRVSGFSKMSSAVPHPCLSVRHRPAVGGPRLCGLCNLGSILRPRLLKLGRRGVDALGVTRRPDRVVAVGRAVVWSSSWWP